MGTGEFDLIARLVERVPSSSERIRVGSGDDAAVTEPSERAVATTVDAVVEDVHFTLPEFPLDAVGRKALAAALSDLAAMAAEPGEAYVSLAAPARLDSEREGVPLVRRTGAGAGDVVVLTGELGGAAAALALLSGEADGEALTDG